MNILSKVFVDGFWGTKTINVSFHKDVNFFIGVNGSGKTTIINLIAAALSADFATLDRLEFNLIRIELQEVGGRRKPVIEIEKSISEDSPYPSIIYRIKEKSSEQFKTYSLDEFEEESMIRRRMSSRHYQIYLRQMNRGILARLSALANVSWLSIHRATRSDNTSREESYESTVDQKLDELGTSLVKYFSSLSTRVATEIAEFQRNVIVSLLTEQTSGTVISSVKKLNLEEEKQSLVEIFNKLNIPTTARQKLDKHYRDVADSLRRFEEHHALQLPDIMLLVNSYRSHKVVQDWNRLLEKQAEIFRPRDTFISVLNSLFQRKEIRITGRNELEVVTQSGKTFSIRGLSSGEKQLIIILGEALLQQSSPWIYIADEPELSLHVKWQESLVSNLLKLNPEAQILCATHSPDVVSTYHDNVFDMEKEIR